MFQLQDRTSQKNQHHRSKTISVISIWTREIWLKVPRSTSNINWKRNIKKLFCSKSAGKACISAVTYGREKGRLIPIPQQLLIVTLCITDAKRCFSTLVWHELLPADSHHILRVVFKPRLTKSNECDTQNAMPAKDNIKPDGQQRLQV